MSDMFEKAKDLTRGHEAETDAALDRAAQFANERTGGSFAGAIDQARTVADANIGDPEAAPADDEAIADQPRDGLTPEARAAEEARQSGQQPQI